MWDFVESAQSSYTVVTLLPSIVLGKHLLATNINTGSTNDLIWYLLAGGVSMPLMSRVVHVEDVAKCHVQALDEKVPGNQRYIIDNGETFQYDDAIDYV